MSTEGRTRMLTGTIELDKWLIFAKNRHLDPYLLWALFTRFRQFFKNGELTPVIDFLVQLHDPVQPGDEPFKDLQDAGVDCTIPPVYLQPMPGTQDFARHITVRLNTRSARMPEISRMLLRLLDHAAVERAQIGFPRPLYTLPAQGAPVPSHKPQPADPTQPPQVLLGVLDDGCPFAHAALLDAQGKTRVRWLWDQTSRTDDAEDADDPSPTHLGYGRERSARQLQTLITAHTHGGLVEEEALYQDPRSLQPQPVSRSSHAASVLGLLAGRHGCRPRHTRSADIPAIGEDIPAFPQPWAEDAAASAPLAVVQFPREQINIAGARWMMVRALDGLRYLAHASASLGTKEAPVPLVVNLSYGGVASAHDGTGLLETAIDELAPAHGRMAVVMAAGNSFGTARVHDQPDALQRRPSGRHFEHLAWTRADGPTGFTLYVPPHKPIETYLEIWFEPAAGEQPGFMTREEVTFQVRSPSGQLLIIRRWPDVALDPPASEDPYAALIALPQAAQSLNRSMALLVVAATRMSTSRLEVAAGDWAVEMCNQGQRRWNVRAWVERDVIPRESARRQSARLTTPLPGGGTLCDEDGLNSVATGAHAFRAGALLARLDDGGHPHVSAYSASAARGAREPELSAVADESQSRAGIRTAGVGSAAVVRANGTSLSAPQAARWMASQLAAGRSIADIRTEINNGEADLRRGRVHV